MEPPFLREAGLFAFWRRPAEAAPAPPGSPPGIAREASGAPEIGG